MADLYLYDEIGANVWTGEGVSARKFQSMLEGIGRDKVVNLYIDSPGGSVFDGIAIYNQIKRHPATVNVVVDGLAASAASVVAMAGDRITMAQNAFLMIHNAWSIAIGEASDLRKVADELEKISGQLTDTYVARSGVERLRVVDMMNRESWMTAEEAVELGFADAVEPNKEAKAYADIRPFGFSHPPDRVAASIRPRKMNKYEMNRVLNRTRVRRIRA